MKNYIYPALYLILVLFLFASCRKLVDIDSPKNQLTSDKVFADSANATEAVIGMYAKMMPSFSLGFTSGGMTAYPGLAGDELIQTTTDVNSQFYANNISVQNTTNATLWRTAFSILYSANACIEGVAGSSGLTEAQKAQLTSEARCVRAFVNFYLVNLYGGVPLVLTTDYHLSGNLPRATSGEVYAQIVADLRYAQANLPAQGGITQRANYYAATALLAKVLLYQKDYASALQESDKVIRSGNFQLESNPASVFLSTSRETIWKLLPTYAPRETWEAYYFVPSSATVAPRYVLTNYLLDAFQAGDLRKANWVRSSTIRGQNYSYPYKYKHVASGTATPEHYVLLRLAEQYLIRAEARANLDDLSGARADLNQVRNRAGLASLVLADKAGLLAGILQERRVELFCEWGNRWFDLKRLGQADAVLSQEKPGWRTPAQWFPIPQAEIGANPALQQNAGY